MPQKEGASNDVSEIPNDSEIPKEKFSEIPNTSGFQNLNSATQKNFSENPQRNTIYNTKYNTIYTAGPSQNSSEIPKEEKNKINLKSLPGVKKEELIGAAKGVSNELTPFIILIETSLFYSYQEKALVSVILGGFYYFEEFY